MEQVSFLVGLFHRPFDFPVRKHLISFDIYFVNLDFLFLIDINVNDHLVFVGEVVGLLDIHLGIFEALLFEMFLDNRRGAVYDIGRYLVSFDQAQTHFQVFPFALFDTVIIDLRDTGLLFQLDFEPRFIAIGFGPFDNHIREESLPPKFLGGIGNSVTRDFNDLSHFETRIPDQHIIFIVGGSGNGNPGDLVFLGNCRIDDFRIIYGIEFLFGLCRHSRHAQRQKQKNSQTPQRHIISHFQFLHL